MTKHLGLICSNLPFVVGVVTLGAVSCRLKTIVPLLAIPLLPTFNYKFGDEK